jgi:hypothetical protein
LPDTEGVLRDETFRIDPAGGLDAVDRAVRRHFAARAEQPVPQHLIDLVDQLVLPPVAKAG